MRGQRVREQRVREQRVREQRAREQCVIASSFSVLFVFYSVCVGV